MSCLLSFEETVTPPLRQLRMVGMTVMQAEQVDHHVFGAPIVDLTECILSPLEARKKF